MARAEAGACGGEEGCPEARSSETSRGRHGLLGTLWVPFMEDSLG